MDSFEGSSTAKRVDYRRDMGYIHCRDFRVVLLLELDHGTAAVVPADPETMGTRINEGCCVVCLHILHD